MARRWTLFGAELDAKVIAVGETEEHPFCLRPNRADAKRLDAHRLIRLADKEGVKVRSWRRYSLATSPRRDISNRPALLDVVAEAGLDRHKAEVFLSGDEGLEAFSEAHEQARRVGVEGVPFFIVNGMTMMSGAQPPGAFLEAFRQLVAEE